VPISKEKRKFTRVRPRGIMAHVRAPTSAFACQVENLSAGGLFLRTEQQLPRGTGLQIELVKPGGRKPIELAGLVAGVITPEEAATARFIPGLGVQFTEIDADEANRLEELLTALGVEQPQAVVSAAVRRTNPASTPRARVGMRTRTRRAADSERRRRRSRSAMRRPSCATSARRSKPRKLLCRRRSPRCRRSRPVHCRARRRSSLPKLPG